MIRPAIGPPRQRTESRAQRGSLPRVAIDLPVELHVSGLAGPLGGRSRDIGLGGVCVVTPTRFSLKDLRRVTLRHPTGDLVLDAEGRWCAEAPGEDCVFTGIRFYDPEPAVIDRLWDLVSDQTKALVRFLGHHSEFKGLCLGDVMELAQLTRLRELRAGRRLYAQDSRGLGSDSMFIVSAGRVVLEVRSQAKRRFALARIEHGELFGGLGAVADCPPGETAIAATDCSLLEISGTVYENMKVSSPALAFRVAAVVLGCHARRLQGALGRLVDGERGPVTPRT